MVYFAITITALITFLVMVEVLSSFRCELSWRLYEENCYLVTNIQTNWGKNKIFCEEQNATLTSIHSDSENKFVANLCNSYKNTYCYIGLRKENESTNFTWIDGSHSTYIWPTWKKPNKNISINKAYVVSIDANTTHWLRNKQNRKNVTRGNKNAVCKKAANEVITDILTTIIYENVTTTVKSTTGAELTTPVKPTLTGAKELGTMVRSTTSAEELDTTVKSTTGAEELDTTVKSTTGGKELTTTKSKTTRDNTGRYTLDDLLDSGRNGKPPLNFLKLAASTDGIDQSLLDWVPPGIQNETALKFLHITVTPVHGKLSEADVSGLKTSIDVDNCSSCQATVMNLKLDIILPKTHRVSGVKGDLKMVGRFISIGVYSNRTKPKELNMSFTVHKEMMNESLDHRHTSVHCAFVDVKKRVWSEDGCRTNARSDGGVTCSCNHLTSFGILLQVKDSPKQKALTAITYVCLGISLLSLLLLLPVYCFFRDLWKSTRIFIHTNLVLNLMATYVTFLSGIDSNENNVCRFVGVTIHFTLLSLFMWMMAEAIFIALKVTKTNSAKRNIRRYYFIICYSVSVLIVGITFAVDKENYSPTYPCWLNLETGARYAIVVPASTIITFNTAVLVMTLRTIYRKSRSRLPRSEQIKNKSILKTVKATLFLVPVFGVTWIFGPFTLSKETKFFEYLFVIFNCLQGLAIFIVYCLLDVEVREQFAKWRARRKRLKEAKSVSSQQQRQSMEEKGPHVSQNHCSATREACNPQIDNTVKLQNKKFSGDDIIKVEET